MTKIVFFDIDGTLVSFNTHTIPQSALDAIKSLRSRGIKVWIATGRPMPFINNLGDLEYDGIISATGSHCQTKDGEVIFLKPVDKADIQRMIEHQHKTGMAVAYAGNKQAIMTAPNGITENVKEIFQLLDIHLPELHEPEEALNFDVMEVIAFFTADEATYIMNNVLRGCSDARWHPEFVDCVTKGSNKASAIDKVIARYGFDISETMAFGDGGNDIPMLQHAAIGVAMGNASDEVKHAADVVTSSVDEDGIAKILNDVDNQESFV